MKFDSIVPILYSTDVARSIKYYTEKLDFDTHWEWDEPPTFGGVNKGDFQIFFCKEGQGNPGTWLSIFVEDIDTFYEMVLEKGAKILNPPQTFEWGVREMLVEDPDGHKLRFGQGVSEILIEDNEFTRALRKLDVDHVKGLIEKESKWLNWSEEDGKSGIHFLCSIYVEENSAKEEASFQILQFLIEKGVNMDLVYGIKEKGDVFPATPLWFAYAKGRNKKVYKWLLEQGANPDNCMFAIAWQNDVEAAELFKKYGAKITDKEGKHTPFIGAVNWNKLDIARWFLKNGAGVNAQDEDGNSALLLSVKREYPTEFIVLLLNHGADIHLKNNEGLSALDADKKNVLLSLI